MVEDKGWLLRRGSGPLVAAANHSGHMLREELARLSALDEADRFREEDPFTDQWTDIADHRVIPLKSRFEIDLNRAREEAFYLEPKDAWGLQLWKQKPSPDMVQRSLEYYDAYYLEMERWFREIEEESGRFVVLDLHSYNHRRHGPEAPPEDPEKNPEINVGTGTMDRKRWAPLVDRFIRDLREFDFLGKKLDVRENVKFIGRQFPKWIHQSFPHSGCALAIEVKKIFMDEWSGELDPRAFAAVHQALQSTVPGILAELKKMKA